VIPIGDENRAARLTPVVNYAIIAINVLVFLYQLTLTEPELQRFILTFGAIPYELTHNVALNPPSPIPVYLTVLTSMFMHGGWLHIIGNMLFLWIFGDNVEDAMGHVKYLIFYLLGGTAAAVAQTLIAPDSTIPMVGASGAIAAVMAAYLVSFPKNLVRVLVFLGFFVTVFRVPALIMIGIWFLLQFITGVASLGVATAEQSGGVAFWAHIGGFIAGLLLVWIFRNPKAVERQRMAQQTWRGYERR
jgi:membrane associated rhomboid family serine protease